MKQLFNLLKFDKEDGGVAGRTLFYSIIAVTLLLIVFSLEIFAWFAQNKNASISNMELSTLGESDSGSSLSVSVSQNNMSEGFLANQILLYPDSYASVEITLRNNSASNIARSLVLDSVSVLYPTRSADAVIEDKYIYTGCYYSDLNVKFDEDVLPDAQAFFKGFIAPATNAFQYAVYTEERTTFDDAYVPQSLTELSNATALALQSSVYNQTTVGEAMPISPVMIDGSQSSIINQSGQILMSPAQELTVYLIFYFDPEFYSTRAYNGQNITLRNSNPFMRQRILVYLECIDTVVT